MKSPYHEKQFAKLARAVSGAINMECLDGVPEGVCARIQTLLFEGSEYAYLCIESIDESVIAYCQITRKDLLWLKKEFDYIADLKSGKLSCVKQIARMATSHR